jgi:hypothetical protein
MYKASTNAGFIFIKSQRLYRWYLQTVIALSCLFIFLLKNNKEDFYGKSSD